MRSIVLTTAARYLLPVVLLLSVFVLLRGHHEPGGGFIGGLLVAAALSLYVIAYDVNAARRVLTFRPHSFIAAGLLAALGAGVLGLFRGRPFLAAEWLILRPSWGAELALGTPLLFDFGVYLVVIGVTLLIIFTLAEE